MDTFNNMLSNMFSIWFPPNIRRTAFPIHTEQLTPVMFPVKYFHSHFDDDFLNPKYNIHKNLNFLLECNMPDRHDEK